MSQRLLVIQEHNAVKAGLHWDVRFEDCLLYTSDAADE